MSVKLLTEQHLEFLGLRGGCIGSSESTLVKMPHCWKAHVTAQMKSYLYMKHINMMTMTPQRITTKAPPTAPAS